MPIIIMFSDDERKSGILTKALKDIAHIPESERCDGVITLMASIAKHQSLESLKNHLSRLQNLPAKEQTPRVKKLIEIFEGQIALRQIETGLP